MNLSRNLFHNELNHWIGLLCLSIGLFWWLQKFLFIPSRIVLISLSSSFFAGLREAFWDDLKIFCWWWIIVMKQFDVALTSILSITLANYVLIIFFLLSSSFLDIVLVIWYAEVITSWCNLLYSSFVSTYFVWKCYHGHIT